MMYDAGNAGEVREVVFGAVRHGTTFSLILDQPRTLRIVHTTHSPAGVKIMTQDVESDDFITLHIPRDVTERASADIPNPLST